MPEFTPFVCSIIARRTLLTALAVLVLAFNAHAVPTISTPVFEQTNWEAPDGTLVEANSLWGSATFNVTPDPSATYYLNLVASTTPSGPTSWMVQNMPIFPGAPALAPESVDLNLGELGFNSGDNWSGVHYNIVLSPTVMTAAPAGPLAFSPVGDFTYNAWLESDPFDAEEFRAGAPAGIKNMSPAMLAGPARGLAPIEELNKTCFAGSMARSLDWLNREHNLKMGRTADEIYQDLIANRVSDPTVALDAPSRHADWLRRKIEYAPVSIATKVNNPYLVINPVSGVREYAGDMIAWLLDEYRKGEDLEFAYLWERFDPEKGKIVTGGHIAAIERIWLNEMGDVYVAVHDDSAQGKLGGNRIRSGQLLEIGGNWFWETGDPNVVRQVVAVISESVIPEVSTSVLTLLAFAAVGLTRCRRAGRASGGNPHGLMLTRGL